MPLQHSTPSKQNDVNRWTVPVAFSLQFSRLHKRWNRLLEEVVEFLPLYISKTQLDRARDNLI